MADTKYEIGFNFTNAKQKELLKYLQANQYQLIAYKGAKGPNQVSAGLPTWFSVPFGNMFGEVLIDYTPKYKVYVFNSTKIAANTVISTQVLSAEIGLGNTLCFEQDGSFTAAGASGDGTITLRDNRPPGTPDVTIGLAGQVTLPTGEVYLPFCAFTMTPQGSIIMEPMEQVAIMAARVNLQSGNVQAQASSPGCSFTFSEQTVNYELMVAESTYALISAPGSAAVTPLSSGASLSFLNH